MNKIIILDTNVFANDPSCYKNFPDSQVIIPIVVLEELDKIKNLVTDAGRNSRVAIRNLDNLFSLVSVDPRIGVTLDNNSILKIDISQYSGSNNGQDGSYADNKILACAINQKKQNNLEVVLVSRDINLRLRAKSFSINSQNYDKERKDVSDIYSGFKSIVDPYLGEKILRNQEIEYDENVVDLFPNQFLLVKDENGDNMCSVRRIKNFLSLIKSENPWGLGLRNKEQLYAVNALLDINIPLVSMIGQAGSGKTLIALACALELMINQKAYSKLLIYRPIQPMGGSLGYLPGELSEKLAPWMEPIKDNLEFLLGGGNKKKTRQPPSDSFVRDKLSQFADQIQMEALTYIRGRSISDSIIILDEFQNTSKEEIKTVLTRVGENTKIILTGDLAQIDAKNLDATNNGLTYAVEKFKPYDLAAHITFTKGERSQLATLAAEIL